MTMAKKLPLLAPSIHTFEVNGTYTDCEAKRTVFMAIQKMVSAGKYYRIPYHGSSKKGYSYKRKDGGLNITLADYPDFKKRYITLSGVNLARIAGDPSRLSLTDLSPEGLAMQEQAFLDELEQLGLLEIEDSAQMQCSTVPSKIFSYALLLLSYDSVTFLPSLYGFGWTVSLICCIVQDPTHLGSVPRNMTSRIQPSKTI